MISKNIRSTFQEVDFAIESVKNCFQGLKCSKLTSKMNLILYALRELLNNAVEHGNLSDSHKKIVYRIGCDGQKIYLDVWDEGIGFTLPEPIGDDSANRVLQMISRGLFIIQKMDFQVSVTEGHITAILDI